MQLKNKELIGRSISILQRYSQIYLDRELADLNVGSSHFLFLIHLYHRGGIHQDKLAEHYRIDRATVTKGIRRLENEGYVLREVDESNRRANKLFLTPRGKEIVPKLMRAYTAWMDVITQSLSPRETQVAIELIGKMAASACDFLGDIRLADKMRNRGET